MREHGDNLETDVFLLAQLEVTEAGDHLGDLLHHGADVLPQLVHRDRSSHHRGEAGLQGHQVGRHLLMRLRRRPVRVSGAELLGAVDGLVGGGGEDQQLVPLVGEQPGVQLHRDLLVEREPPGPLHQLEHDAVADAAEFVRQVRRVVV